MLKPNHQWVKQMEESSCLFPNYCVIYQCALMTKLNNSIFKTFLAELTVLPPASWDASIRLEPPKNPPTLETRLVNRVNIRERTRQMEDTEDEEEDAGEKADEDTFLMTGKEEEEDGLQFTGRLFGGLMDDIRRKAPWYVSDFTDALNIQVGW